MRKQYDVAVIGGGPAGYVAAIKASQLGGRAAVFEKSVLGGTCLNRGCIPTKCYLKTAELMEEIAGCAQRGIVLDAHPSVDLPKAVAHKNSVVKKLTDGVAGLLRSHKIDVYYGEAALATETTLTCGGETYGFDSVLLCGGSKPGVIPIPGAESKNVLDSDALLDLEALPRRLAIIGGGVIGCEMAAAFHGFGSQVTVIEAMDRLVPPMDEEISAQLKKSLEKKGIRVLTSQKVSAIQDQGTGSTVLCQDGTRVEADKILICVGRAADLDCLGALKDGSGWNGERSRWTNRCGPAFPTSTRQATSTENTCWPMPPSKWERPRPAPPWGGRRPVTSGTFPPVSIQARRPPGWAFPKKPPGNSTEGKAF